MLNKSKKNRIIEEGFGINAIVVRFNVAQLVAIQHQLYKMNQLNDMLAGRDYDALILKVKSIVDGLAPMLMAITGDFKSPFAGDVWEFDPKDLDDDNLSEIPSRPKHGLDRDDV